MVRTVVPALPVLVFTAMPAVLTRRPPSPGVPVAPPTSGRKLARRSPRLMPVITPLMRRSPMPSGEPSGRKLACRSPRVMPLTRRSPMPAVGDPSGRKLARRSPRLVPASMPLTRRSPRPCGEPSGRKLPRRSPTPTPLARRGPSVALLLPAVKLSVGAMLPRLRTICSPPAPSGRTITAAASASSSLVPRRSRPVHTPTVDSERNDHRHTRYTRLPTTTMPPATPNATPMICPTDRSLKKSGVAGTSAVEG